MNHFILTFVLFCFILFDFPFQSENIPKSEDEKSQQNRFLTEVLDTILTGDFYEE